MAAAAARREKIARLAALLAGLPPAERPLVTAWLAGELPQGRIGVGYAGLREALGATAPAAAPALAAADVDGALTAYAAARGAGSAAARRRILGGLLGAATEDERTFLSGLLLGELRQGALEAILVDAVAQASGAPAAEVRRAAMLAGALPPVASAVLAGGAPALAAFRLRLMEPVRPMLAQPAAGVREALEALVRRGEGEAGRGIPGAALEWKLDGARIQVHRDGEAVRIFTRALRDVTAALPEVVAVARALPARQLILDGEALAVRADGAPEPFQVTMRRFGRKQGVDALAPDLPLTPFFFDVLHLDGEDLLALGNAARHAALARVVPEAHRVPRRVTADVAEAEAFLADALARGQEGLVAKALDAPYEAGRRGGAWLKVKREHTLDLVVLAVEPGSGRRRGWLSNLHLGARDPAGGGFVMLGKTFKGMTDAMLAWQTERLRGLAVGEPEDGYVVRVRPELVVEVAFDGLQASPRYPGGLALRFARVKRYREDKRAEDADTVETVRALYAQQGGDAAGEREDGD